MDTSYTRDRITTAVNAGADLVMDNLELGDRDRDLLNLVVNAALSLLDAPAMTLDDVIEENYETSPSELRGWWDW